MENSFITKKEEKLRKRWLIVGLFNWIILPFACCFFVSLMFIFYNRSDLFFDYFASSIIAPAIGAALFFPLYLCAYREHASRLLNFYMFMGVLGCIFNFFSIFNKTSELFVFIIELSFFVFHIWWLILSSKLLDINKKIRERIKVVEVSDEEPQDENNS